MYQTQIAIIGMILCVIGLFVNLLLHERDELKQKQKEKELENYRKAEREYYEVIHNDPNWIGE